MLTYPEASVKGDIVLWSCLLLGPFGSISLEQLFSTYFALVVLAMESYVTFNMLLISLVGAKKLQ